jgi:hypothetical protein
MIKYKCCNRSAWQDLTQGLGHERNYYCVNCKAHIFKRKFYAAPEWEKWIEGEDKVNFIRVTNLYLKAVKNDKHKDR